MCSLSNLEQIIPTLSFQKYELYYSLLTTYADVSRIIVFCRSPKFLVNFLYLQVITFLFSYN